MPKIICFHAPDEPNGYLSNWYPSPFTAAGRHYSSITVLVTLPTLNCSEEPNMRSVSTLAA